MVSDNSRLHTAMTKEKLTRTLRENTPIFALLGACILVLLLIQLAYGAVVILVTGLNGSGLSISEGGELGDSFGLWT